MYRVESKPHWLYSPSERGKRFFDLEELEKAKEDEDQHYLNIAKRVYAKDDQPAVIAQYGTWAVTEHGLECLVQPYTLSKKQLLKTWGNLLHLAGKNELFYGTMGDFVRGLEAAQRYHYPKKFGTQARWDK